MKIQEVLRWKAFQHPDGNDRDLSFLDAHEVIYVHKAEGKTDKIYKFFVTYSFHCFCKEYEQQTAEKVAALMYYAPKDQRPFCERRYTLAKNHLRRIVETLGEKRVIHAGYGNYAVIELDLGEGETEYYFVSFSAFRELKKLRLHITSAYPIEESHRGQPVSIFAIARNLLAGKNPPGPPK